MKTSLRQTFWKALVVTIYIQTVLICLACRTRACDYYIKLFQLHRLFKNGVFTMRYKYTYLRILNLNRHKEQ